LQLWQILLVIIIILLGVLVGLFFWGRKLEKRQAEQEEQIEAAKQQVTILVIDKKRLPVKESGLPQMVIDQVPKLMRRQKLPIVKARLQGRVLNMIADEKIYDLIPTKKEVKATISGIYITDVRAIRGTLERPSKKKSFRQKLLGARERAQAGLGAEEKSKKKK
jgi:uncharacterized protein YneF (UPF0154 family)